MHHHRPGPREPQFQSTLPVWGATILLNKIKMLCEFQSTLPVWGATYWHNISFTLREVFQSTLPVWGATPASSPRRRPTSGFQSTLPVWGATQTSIKIRSVLDIFQSTLPVWGATFCPARRPMRLVNFNPRSPCGERRGQQHQAGAQLQISIHAPRVGSDPRFTGHFNGTCSFQSTLPVWGATYEAALALERTGAFQSTLPVWGATPPVGGIPLGPG